MADDLRRSVDRQLPAVRSASTTYRVSEEALLVNVSINLEPVDA